MKWYSDWCAVVEDRGVVIAHQRQHAALFGGAARLAWRKTSRCDRRQALCRTTWQSAVVFALERSSPAGAPHRPGGKSSLMPALEADVILGQERRGAKKLAVEAAERRAAITGDVARGIEAVTAV